MNFRPNKHHWKISRARERFFINWLYARAEKEESPRTCGSLRKERYRNGWSIVESRTRWGRRPTLLPQVHSFTALDNHQPKSRRRRTEGKKEKSAVRSNFPTWQSRPLVSLLFLESVLWYSTREVATRHLQLHSKPLWSSCIYVSW